MAEIGYVDIEHKDSGLTSTVLESTFPAWESAGWTRADNGSEESGQQQQPQTPSSPQTPGDPDDMNEE